MGCEAIKRLEGGFTATYRLRGSVTGDVVDKDGEAGHLDRCSRGASCESGKCEKVLD
jgi:hypothetical protein